jgi:putative ABC transport system ATP-binding protein
VTKTPARDVQVPLALEEVTKVYVGTRAARALDGVTLRPSPGSFTALMGPSGSGKSTLLQCAAGLYAPTSGTVTLLGRPLAGLPADELTRLRRERVAFVFQLYNRIPALTVRQNVALPAILAGRRPDQAAVERAIDLVGLGGRSGYRPGELSGGQQQRVAIARALAARAAVLFADEPTGALDTITARSVLRLLRDTARETGQTVLMATHDPVAASYADTVVFLVDGRLAGQLNRPGPEAVSRWIAALADSGQASEAESRSGAGGAR